MPTPPTEPTEPTEPTPPTRADIAIIGDSNPDVVLLDSDADVRFGQQESMFAEGGLTVGGSGSITACACARLGLRTRLIGAMADDAFGRYMTDELQARGIDISSGPLVDDASTGFSVIVSRGDDRAILTYAGTIGRLTRADLPMEVLRCVQHVHISSYFLLDGLRPELPAVLIDLRAAGVTISLDTNWDPTERWDGGLREVLPLVDVFLPNAAEARAITRQADSGAAARALARRTRIAAVKVGSEGAIVAYGDELHRHPGFPIDAVDTTGAGDAFNAGFLRGWITGSSPRECLELGAAVGALSTLGLGAVRAQPDFAAASALIRQRAGTAG